MTKKTTVGQTSSTAVCYETIESFARLEIQRWGKWGHSTFLLAERSSASRARKSRMSPLFWDMVGA